jgi:Mrp family chromosome partitioning ATPase
MSSIDQAFIRAYGEKPSPAAVPLPAPNVVGSVPTVPESLKPDAAEQPECRFTTIHVGLGSVVPPPHVSFSGHRATTTTSRTTEPVKKTAEPGEPADQKLPLSSFSSARAKPLPPNSWKPALEVDLVKWPAICQELLTQYADRFDGLTDEICRRASREKLLVAITGLRRGEGRTVLSMCLARRLAAANLKLALVDADFENPHLAGNLGLAVDRGWESIIDGDASAHDLMIESIVDRFALLPLQASVPHAKVVASAYRLAATLDQLVEHHEVVLIDAGPIDADENHQHWLLNPAIRIDAVIMARDMRHNDAGQWAAMSARLASARRSPWGIAELFLNERSAA